MPRVNRQSFISSLDENGQAFFEAVLDFAEKNNLPIHWGSKGFYLNVDLEGNHVNILYGYPPQAVYKQSIYTVCAEIIRKVEDGETIAKYFQEKLKSLGGFEQAGQELKMMINNSVFDNKKEKILDIMLEIIHMIRENGLRE